MKKQNLIIPAVMTAGFTGYILATPASTFDMSKYAMGLVIIFALGAKSMKDNTDKYYVLVGYLFWNLAYLWQIYYDFNLGVSNWPLFTGSYWVVNEFITCCTNYYETPNEAANKYVTPLYVRIGYYVFFALDFFLNLVTIYMGTGSDYDELGLFPMKTMEQRAMGFVFWCSFWLATQINLSKTFGPRQAKYSMAAFQYICQLSILRLPVFQQIQSHDGIANIMKFQTFGSAFWMVRIKAPCEPQILFRVLLFCMSPFCALTATTFFPAITVGLATETFMYFTVAWLSGFWVVLIALEKYSKAKVVLPALDEDPVDQKIKAN